MGLMRRSARSGAIVDAILSTNVNEITAVTIPMSKLIISMLSMPAFVILVNDSIKMSFATSTKKNAPKYVNMQTNIVKSAVWAVYIADISPERPPIAFITPIW